MTIEVVAALIVQDGQFMICQRPPHKNCGLMWEFPGGKVEKGESGPDALVRECQEELGVTLAVGEMFTTVQHVYPAYTVHLTLFLATLQDGEPQLMEHQALRWITAAGIPGYVFAPADAEIIADNLERFMQLS